MVKMDKVDLAGIGEDDISPAICPQIKGAPLELELFRTSYSR